MTPQVSDDEVRSWMGRLSNHGRWGPGDEAGTLNHAGPAERVRAAQLVEIGTAVSCALPLERRGRQGEPFLINVKVTRTPQRPSEPAAGWQAASERIDTVFHGQSITHIDAPAHFFWHGQGYNGITPADVTDADGALRGGVSVLASGCVTRGVLLDVAGSLAVDWLEPGQGIGVELLQQVADQSGVELQRGDIVLVRTGYGRKRIHRGPDRPSAGLPGLRADCLPWLFDSNIAILGSDTTNDVIPSGYPDLQYPVHVIGLAAMGLWLIDNCNLEPLVEACRAAGRYQFMIVLAPLGLRGGTGSPVNPIAVL